jgi:hypothetical protein
MKLHQLGRSGLSVAEFALGTMTVGLPEWGCGQERATKIIHRYLDAGGSLIDAAGIYGAAGASELICGRAREKSRSQVVLATKFGLASGMGPHEAGTSRFHIKAACDESLQPLMTDYIYKSTSTTPRPSRRRPAHSKTSCVVLPRVADAVGLPRSGDVQHPSLDTGSIHDASCISASEKGAECAPGWLGDVGELSVGELRAWFYEDDRRDAKMLFEGSGIDLEHSVVR